MYIVSIQFTVVCYWLTGLHVYGQGFIESEDVDAIDDKKIEEKFIFVTLLDIAFTDSSKKTCTGTIIDDTVILTAGHCFLQQNNAYILPELSLSFVVLGTKKMFETGYEQYLPIERVLTHPNIKGWSYDLALVYTFASMNHDKPGKIIPLAGYKLTSMPESNITVLSWGHCKNSDSKTASKRKQRKQRKNTYETGTKMNVERRGGENKSQLGKLYDLPVFEGTSTKKRLSPDYKRHGINKESSAYSINRDLVLKTKKSNYPYLHFNGWRRSMGSQENSLTTGIFGFISSSTCKKTVERAMQDTNGVEFKHNSEEVICYASEEHYITNEDSGAPAVYHDKLLAITVGGAQCDGEHVAVGLKISCFCKWIQDNLPAGGTRDKIDCCIDCCDPHEKESAHHQSKSEKKPMRIIKNKPNIVIRSRTENPLHDEWVKIKNKYLHP